MLDFPVNQFSAKNQIDREMIDAVYDVLRRSFQGMLMKSRFGVKEEIISPLTDSIYPISQKHSEYSELPYGETGTVGSGGCGPLAVEYALRLLGYGIPFLDILNECVRKGYRAYEFDENGKIVAAAGTEDYLFHNLANEPFSLLEIFEALKEKKPVTILVDNAIYHDDINRNGNHFVTLIGIDSENNAIIMDGNKIVNCKEEAKVVMPLFKILPGIKGAWIWNKKKVKNYLE